MRKILFVLPMVTLFAAGCTAPQQAPVVQNPTSPSATPTARPTPTLAPTPTTSSIYINSLSPTSGLVGTEVTVTGSGFSATGNRVNFASGAITSISAAANGATLAFSVPQSVGPYCAPGKACPIYVMLVKPGTYSISVTNSTGLTSNTLPFTVTGSSGNPLLNP